MKSFTDIFIKRPVFASALSLLIIVIGLIAYQKLNVRQFPQMDANVIQITTTYTGASASLVESFITTPLENAISGIDGIDYIESSSSPGKSRITLNLTLNSDIDSAMVDVNSDLSSILKKLPDGVDDPVVRKVDSDSMPQMILAFSSSHMDPPEITDYLTRSIIPQLSNLPGVGSAEILGNRTYAMRIWLNPKLMSQLEVTATDIQAALQENNVQSQPGEINRSSQDISINAETDLSTPEQFGNIVIKHDGSKLVRMRDIAKVELGTNNSDITLIVNGKQAVGIGVISKSNANPLAVAQAVKTQLKLIEQTLPDSMQIAVPRDSTIYIQRSIDEVNRSIIEASICVILVIFMFIGSIRSVMIPIVTIPLSLVGACAFMFAMGYTINTITLLAFVLAIGMVVDDAIVVLENIHRHIELGSSPFQAAIKGAREISFAVVAMTITLAAVYTPLGFTGGFTGALFREFAFTLAGTVIISGFIALTLTPMMCSKIMKPSEPNSKSFAHVIDVFFTRFTEGYKKALNITLKNRLMVVIATIAVFICGAMLFLPLYLTSRLTPSEDQGAIIGMALGPTAANIDYTNKYTKQLEPLFDAIPEHASYVIISGRPDGSKAQMYLNLKDWSLRDRSANEIIQTLTPDTQKVTGIKTMLMNPSSLPGSKSMYPMEFIIKTTGSYEELNTAVQKLVVSAEKNHGFLRLDTDLKLNKPEINVKINRDKASSLGISMDDIATALNIAYGEPSTTTFSINGLSYDVIPQVNPHFRGNPKQINNINVKTASGDSVPLSSIIKVENVTNPSSLNHFQQQRSATIQAVLNPTYSTSAALTFLENLAKKDLPSNMSFDFAGDTRTFISSGSSMAMIFVFALVFIFLVLSAQFESFIAPLIVLFSVPLSLVGALATLLFTGCSLNIYTEIGLITLIGLISKHGILIVEFANQLQEQGCNAKEAVIESASVRLRPILMTTAAMVLGAIPLAIASGAGATARQQMGLTIIGGMTFGTLLTLFVVPTIYTFLAKNRKRLL
jgi:multidrug efflux pump